MRAGLAQRAADWRWSSARTLLGLEHDLVTAASGVRARWPDLAALLESAEDAERTERLRKAESIGRPIGSEAFVQALEARFGRVLTPAKRGPRARGELSALSP